jgi:hypothetical protein
MAAPAEARLFLISIDGALLSSSSIYRRATLLGGGGCLFREDYGALGASRGGAGGVAWGRLCRPGSLLHYEEILPGENRPSKGMAGALFRSCCYRRQGQAVFLKEMFGSFRAAKNFPVALRPVKVFG